MNGFDLQSCLKGVSGLNTRDRIEYITLDRIDPDERNFYSLDGIEELAASIELVGLQQPIRVRRNGERYVVVSGHRRRAACLLIRDGGSDMFNGGVPCIVETGDVSEELQELRLIYANSATRVLSPAETSRQIERVTELLYKLKEQGVEFPGRMRDHVAEACNVSKTKIARLNAIRNNLCPGFLGQFDEGILTESAAYELQKLPAEIQEALASEKWLAKRRGINASCAKNVSEFLDKTHNAPKCPGGSECSQPTIERLKFMAYAQYSWKTCDGECCLHCYHRSECSYRCDKCRDEDKKKAADDKRERDAIKRREDARQQENRDRIQQECQRFLPLIEAAGLPDDEHIEKNGKWDFTTAKAVRKFAAGEFGDATFYNNTAIVPRGAVDVVRIAKQLSCSADFICGLTDDPTPANERVLKSDTGWITDRDPVLSANYVLAYGRDNMEVCFFDAEREEWLMWSGDDMPIRGVRGWMLIPPLPEVKG